VPIADGQTKMTMMKKTIIFGTLLTILFVFQSCTKDTSVKNDIQGLWDCNASQNFDSTKLADKLIGSWQWTKSSSELVTKKADKKVVVTFTSDRKFTVVENSAIITQGNWRLKIVDSGILGLSLDTTSQFLYGRILLCESQVVFNDSYRDGTDNFFVSTK